MVCGPVQAQSAIMSLNDIYWIIAIALIPLILQFLFLPSSKGQRCRSGALENFADFVASCRSDPVRRH
jgi:hypothetical protein